VQVLAHNDAPCPPGTSSPCDRDSEDDDEAPPAAAEAERVAEAAGAAAAEQCAGSIPVRGKFFDDEDLGPDAQGELCVASGDSELDVVRTISDSRLPQIYKHTMNKSRSQLYLLYSVRGQIAIASVSVS
jgi:hypothetical protein